LYIALSDKISKLQWLLLAENKCIYWNDIPWKKSFKIAALFAFALCLSSHWLNLVVRAGWQLRKGVSQCVPSCRWQCEGRRDTENALDIFPCNGYPKSSRVSQNLTIHFSSSGVSSRSFWCVAHHGWTPWSQTWKVPYSVP
jgi:hypothetical protein